MHLLLIESNLKRAKQIKTIFHKMDYAVDHFTSAEAALTRLERHVSSYSLVVVNVEMDQDIFTWCEAVKEINVNIPVLTYSIADNPILLTSLLLDYVDDFITLPIRSIELVARIQALSRRSKEINNSGFKIGELYLDKSARQLFCGPICLKVSRKELLITELLMQNSPNTVPYEKVYGYVWEVPDAVIPNALNAHVKNLRQKIPQSSKCSIETVRGIGYKMVYKRR